MGCIKDFIFNENSELIDLVTLKSAEMDILIFVRNFHGFALNWIFLSIFFVKNVWKLEKAFKHDGNNPLLLGYATEYTLYPFFKGIFIQNFWEKILLTS
jgi:hypothetical protein